MEDTIDAIGDAAPSAKITIDYPNGKTVEFGKELTPTDVRDTPQVSWDADPTKFYTLVMYDPDAPSRADPSLADVKHWLVVNVQGNDLSTGDALAEYRGSLPRKDSGLHRYIFLVFEQKGKVEFDEPKSDRNSREHRIKWSMREFRKKYDLGRPFAGNYYLAQWDEYVDERRREIYGSE